MIDVTLNGTMRMTRYMMKVMKDRKKGGVIVNNASVLGWRAQKEQAHYAAAKAGVTEKSAKKQRAAPASTGRRRRRTPLSEIMRAFQSKRSIWRVSDGRDRAQSVWKQRKAPSASRLGCVI